MAWTDELFGVKKPIIAMCHLHALPGDPAYDLEKGVEWVIERGRQDLDSLQRGGVDGVMFSNEFSIPYQTKVESIATATMAAVIGELKSEIEIPFGVNVLWDPLATVDLAVATGAHFVREIFTGVYASDFGLWNTDYGSVARHLHALHGDGIKLIFNIVPEAAMYLAGRTPSDIAHSTVFNTRPDALCVSGATAGVETSKTVLLGVKEAVPETIVLANTGVDMDNMEDQISAADGAIVGTAFKVDGNTWNDVDPKRVESFMTKVNKIRN